MTDKDEDKLRNSMGANSQTPTSEHASDEESKEKSKESDNKSNEATYDNQADATEQESSFNHAMKELGESMSELASARSAEALNSAIPLIKDAAERIRSQARGKPQEALAEHVDDSYADSAEERFASAQAFADTLRDHDASQLYLDHNKRVAGVCAALARYFGMDTFTVRMLAVTGLIFIPQVAFPAYWICYFMFDKKDGSAGGGDQSRRQRRKQRKRERRAMRALARASEYAGQYGGEGYGWSKAQLRKMRRKGYRLPIKWLNWQRDHDAGIQSDKGLADDKESGSSAAKVRAAVVAPEVTLRKARFHSKELETRLRRLESFVTSKQFYLHKELTKLEL